MFDVSWIIYKGEPFQTEAAVVKDEAMTYPYPLSYWRINEFYNPYHLLFDKDLAYGAFANAVNLSSIRIPPSVKKIGWDAFAHTQLTSVTIARDCEYYETSFPKGCEINFYD